jgi:hypothetical protein
MFFISFYSSLTYNTVCQKSRVNFILILYIIINVQSNKKERERDVKTSRQSQANKIVNDKHKFDIYRIFIQLKNRHHMINIKCTK